jgi:thiamine pyrophosphokinase
LIRPDDFIICADKGANNAARLGIWPDVLIGDFDSIEPPFLEQFKSAGVKIISYPAEKDETDTQLALDYAMSLKPKEIILTGALGKRPDHSLANIFLLLRADDAGMKCSIVESRGKIYLTSKSMVIRGRPGDLVSILSLGKAEGVDLTGFKYPSKDGVLDYRNPALGVSNELVGDKGNISVSSGVVLVFQIGSQR